MKRYDHSDGGMDLELDGEYVRYEDAAARIAELEIFKQQWAVADAALVRAYRRIAELEAEFAQFNKGVAR